MGHILSELLPFLASVFTHWQIWLSGGGIGGLIVLAANIVEKVWGKTLSTKAHVYIFLVAFFLCSCFLSWVDVHDALDVSKTQKSEQHDEYERELQKSHNDYGDLKYSCAFQAGVATTLGNQNRDQQNSINNCQTEAIRRLTPEPLQIVSVLETSDESIPQGFVDRFLVFSNRKVDPFRVTIRCAQIVFDAVDRPVTPTTINVINGYSREGMKDFTIDAATPLTALTPHQISIFHPTKNPGCTIDAHEGINR